MHEQELGRKPCCTWQHTSLQPILQRLKSYWLLTGISMLKASYLAALYKARHWHLVLPWALRGKDLTTRRNVEEAGLISKTSRDAFSLEMEDFLPGVDHLAVTDVLISQDGAEN